MVKRKRYRTVIISDCHLGVGDENFTELLAFFASIETDKIIFNGDIIDVLSFDGLAGLAGLGGSKGTDLERNCPSFFELLAVAKTALSVGGEFWYLRGNHDDFLKDEFCGFFNQKSLKENWGIRMAGDYILEKQTGQRYFVIHGDQLDMLRELPLYLVKFGDLLYYLSRLGNKISDKIFRFLRIRKVNWSRWFKMQFKIFLAGGRKKFERKLRKILNKKECSGLIYGHIHYPLDYKSNGIHILNCGDWLASNSAVVEELNGDIKLLRFEKTN